MQGSITLILTHNEPPSLSSIFLMENLIGGLTRRLDEDVLHLNSIESRGWQSMGVLHYLGLTNSFKALFEDMTISSAIYELKSSNTDDYCVVIALLESLL